MRDAIDMPRRAYAVVAAIAPYHHGAVIGNPDRNVVRPHQITFSIAAAETTVKDMRYEVFKHLGRDANGFENEAYVKRCLDYRETIGIIVLSVEEVAQALTHG